MRFTMAGTSCHKKRESLLAFILLSVLFMGTDASIYSRSIALKTDTYIEWSEGPMFSSNSFPSGEAYIELLLNFSTTAPPESKVAASVVCLGPDEKLGDECEYLSNVTQAPYTQTYIMLNTSAPPNSTVPVNVVSTSNLARCEIKEEGNHVVILSLCTDYDGIVVQTGAELRFHNPYGWLPASWYGQVVTTGLVFAFCIILDLIFIFLFCKHRQTTMWLQWLILPVILIMTVEAITTFAGFLEINASGVPVCCPTPTTLYTGSLLYVFLRTAARVLILIIALGYGVVRPRLTFREMFLVSALGIFYATAGLLVQVQMYIIQSSPETKGSSQDMYQQWRMLEFLANATFAVWIYKAIVTTRDGLVERNQNAKLQMYNGLYKVYVLYVAVACLFSFLDLAVSGYFFEFDQETYWKFSWVSALQKLFLFMVIAAICLIWRPTRVSYMYAYSQQLPTSEKEADERVGSTKIEINSSNTPNVVTVHLDDDAPPGSFTIGEEHDESPKPKPSNPPNLHASVALEKTKPADSL